jgi:hypothetical protein
LNTTRKVKAVSIMSLTARRLSRLRPPTCQRLLTEPDSQVAERAGRHEQTIGERLVADQTVLRPLPEAPFEPCDKRPAKVSSTALVRYRMNDYSVPTAYGFRDVLVKGFVDKVAIICGADEIARHSRIYGRGQFVFDPKHYLALRHDAGSRCRPRTLPAGRREN